MPPTHVAEHVNHAVEGVLVAGVHEDQQHLLKRREARKTLPEKEINPAVHLPLVAQTTPKGGQRKQRRRNMVYVQSPK